MTGVKNETLALGTTRRRHLLQSALAVLPAVLVLSCSTPYYERAVDPPGFSYGGGAALKTEVYTLAGDMWAHTLGPALTGYARLHGPGRLSLSGQLDIEYQFAFNNPPLPKGYRYASGTLTGGLKAQTWKRAAVEVVGGAYMAVVRTPWMYESSYAPTLDFSLLQDLPGRYPVTGRITVGTGGLQIGFGAEKPLSDRLLARMSAGLTVLQLTNTPAFPAGAHIGLAIEPISKQN